MRLVSYVATRAVGYLVATFVATSIAYLSAVTVLDPRARMLQRTPRPTEAQVDAQLRLVGLDPQLSPLERYRDWLTAVVTRWDWGRSPDGVHVNAEFWSRALISGRLLVLATVLSIVVGVTLGVTAAVHHRTLRDRSITYSAFLISVVPAPIVYLAVQFGGIELNQSMGRRIVYVTGMRSPSPPAAGWSAFLDDAQHLVLPTIALTIVAYPAYTLLQRSVLLDHVHSDYVRTARATGLTRDTAIRRHAVRTSFIPVGQTIAFRLPAVFSGAFVVETVFGWQGLGRWVLDAVTVSHSVDVAVAGVAFGAALFAVGAILADLSVALVDPRVRTD